MILPMKRRTLVIGAAGLVGMLAAGWFGWRESSRRAPQANRAVSPPVKVAPTTKPLFAAQLPDLSGQSQALKQWQGKPLVVNFWAPWCAPCVKELPDLNRLAQKHPKATFIGVAIDTEKNVREFIDKTPVTFPIVVAGHPGIDLIRSLGNTAGGLPFTVLIKPDGTVQDAIMGAFEVDALDQQIKQLVASSAV